MLINKYWEELDEIIDRIISKHESADGLDRGRAEIACLFIAMLLKPHKPSIIEVRDEAVRRWKEKAQASNYAASS